MGADTREPAEIAREATQLTRGLDARNGEEWAALAYQLMTTLRQVRELAPPGSRARQLIDDALAEAGVE